MSHDYRVIRVSEALDSLPAAGKRHQNILLYLRELGKTAYLGSNFVREDPETQRPFEVSIVAGFAITWGIDSPVNKVKAIDIRPAR